MKNSTTPRPKPRRKAADPKAARLEPVRAALLKQMTLVRRGYARLEGIIQAADPAQGQAAHVHLAKSLAGWIPGLYKQFHTAVAMLAAFTYTLETMDDATTNTRRQLPASRRPGPRNGKGG